MSASNSILTLENVNLHLKSDAGELHILKDISLDLPKAKTVSIVGPSGSGKTTLLMVVGGLEKISSGNIKVSGRRLNNMTEDALAEFRRENVGIVFQNFHLIPTMTALENVAIPLEFSGKKHAFELAEKALEAVGLRDRIKHYPGQLSGGEQQRVAIARAFAAKPKIILADEPTGNLDETTGKKVMELLFDLTKEQDMTLVLVTHDSYLAKKCDIHVKIKDGKVFT